MGEHVVHNTENVDRYIPMILLYNMGEHVVHNTYNVDPYIPMISLY